MLFTDGKQFSIAFFLDLDIISSVIIFSRGIFL